MTSANTVLDWITANGAVPLSLMVACAWVILANLLAAVPSTDNHWRRAYFLIAIGIPILGWVTRDNGPFVGLLVLAAGASVLRWPLIYLTRWVRRQFAR